MSWGSLFGDEGILADIFLSSQGCDYYGGNCDSGSSSYIEGNESKDNNYSQKFKAQYIYGSRANDTLSSSELRISGKSVGDIIIYAGKGDDMLYSSYKKKPDTVRSRWFYRDILYGEDGNDAFEINSSEYVSRLRIDGGEGTDLLVIAKGNRLSKEFRKKGRKIIAKTEGDRSSVMHIEISPSVEAVFVEDTKSWYLTEDVWNNETEPVSIDEANFRAFGKNSDWHAKDLDTKKMYLESEQGRPVFSSFGDIVFDNKNQSVATFNPGKTTRKILDSIASEIILIGSRKKDNLYGKNKESEIFIGGPGRDFLKGGSKAPDYFVIDTQRVSKRKKVDSILDFKSENGDKLIVKLSELHGISSLDDIRLAEASDKVHFRDLYQSGFNLIYSQPDGYLYHMDSTHIGSRKFRWGESSVLCQFIEGTKINPSDLILI